MKTYPTINRSVVIIKGKQPFYDWSNAIFPDLTPTKMETVKEHNSYLIEEDLLFDDPKVDLKNYWKTIFENQCFGMCTDPETWPKMTWKLFITWFSFEFSSIVHDLTDTELYTEHYE